MADPFVRHGFDVEFGAVGPAIYVVLRALIDDAALRARERLFVGVVFEEILADFRPDELEQKAEVSPEWIVAQDGVAQLRQIEQAERDERDRHDHPEP